MQIVLNNKAYSAHFFREVSLIEQTINKQKETQKLSQNYEQEYEKYVKETFTHKNKSKENDGGQIFTYLQQEPKATKAVCYYASHITGNSLEYKNAIIHNKEDWADLNQIERFNRWSKTFETNGIFEDDIPLFKIESKAICRKDLKELKREDSEGIYNQFAEILRHNVVSDKPNAFNKIINMFLPRTINLWYHKTRFII